MNLDELKYDRLSEPERFLLDMLTGLVEYIHDDYPDSVFYKKDGKLLFEYDLKNQCLYYSYDNIWLVFENEFKYKCQDTCDLVQSMVEQHLKFKVDTTVFCKVVNQFLVEQHLKLKVDTTDI